MAQKEIKKRSEVEKQYTWATEDMFESDQAWFDAFEAAKAYPAEFASFRGRLCESADTFWSYLQLVDKMGLEISLLANYAMRKSDEDTSNSYYQDMRAKLMSLDVEIDSASSFDVPEILAMPESRFEDFCKEKPELELYRRWYSKLVRRKEHILSDAEEKLLAGAGEMSNAPDHIGSVFRNADLKFPDVIDGEGNSHRLTQGSYVPMLESSDRVLRKNAFETLYATFGGFRNTAAALLDAQVRQLSFFAKARKYSNTLEAALDRTEVPENVYHNLIEAVNANLPKMHRYVELRKKLMKLDTLHMYDVYTPVVDDADSEIPYEQAKTDVLEALEVLGEEYVGLLKKGFSERWIDVYENEGKRSGAYSSGGRPHPYVLLNHKDTLDSEFTLAHEMGHALHSYYSIKNQPNIYSHYVIFVAEVASTCNEVLLMRHKLAKTTDKREKAYLLNHFLEQFRGTLYRQTMFAEFELTMNRMVESGQSLTADALCKEYYELNRRYFGEGMEVDKQIEMEWARIPHFFYNFYVFQYATGFSAAVAIANRILAEGKPAVDDYLKFLSSGSTADPISLLKIAGVDMNTPEPVNKALELFEELVDEMEQLLA
ncbi:MAG: oligoendopeptidase F [Clostridia bacterium]|nr:oligoendopeptidase F [Clostridia bacterium]